MRNIKQLLLFVLVLPIILVLGGCVSSGVTGKVTAPLPTGMSDAEAQLWAAAKEDGKVVFCNNLPVHMAESLGKSFEEKYGIEVEVVRIAAGVLAQRFYTEKESGVNTCDVFNNGVTEAFPDWKGRGYFTKLTDLPEWESFPSTCKDKDGYYVDTRTDTTITFYNSDIVTEGQLPKSLWELTEPQWKGKVGIVDPAIAGTWLLWARWVVQHPDLGWEYLEALSANDPVMFAEDGQLTDAIANGRAYITPDELGIYYYSALIKGAPLAVAPLMKEGTITHPQPSGIPTGAPHPNAAKLFMNYLMSKEGQQQHINVGLSTCRLDIGTDAAMPWKPSLEEGWQPDWESLAQSGDRQQFLERVNIILKGQ